MMSGLMAQATRRAAAEKRRLMQRVAEILVTRFNDAKVELTEGGVEVRGRGLNRQWLTDPSIRFMSNGK